MPSLRRRITAGVAMSLYAMRFAGAATVAMPSTRIAAAFVHDLALEVDMAALRVLGARRHRGRDGVARMHASAVREVRADDGAAGTRQAAVEQPAK